MRIFFGILFLIGTMPLMMTGVFQVGAGALMYSHSKSLNDQLMASEERDKPYSDELDVIGHVGERSRVKDGYLALRHPDKLGEFRMISVVRTVPVRDFLEKGEATPSPEFIEILLSTRAARVAERECALLKRYLAEKCTVQHADADVDERGKQVRLKARYRFTQKNGVGHFDSTRPLRFVSVREDVQRKGTPSDSSRNAIYKKVARLCDTLRRKEGNCGISKIYITTRSRERQMLAQVQMNVLQRR